MSESDNDNISFTQTLDTEVKRPDLKDGEFLAKIQIPAATASMKYEHTADLLDMRILQYLAVSPEGTEIKKVLKLDDATSAGVVYEVKFYNPLMKRIKYVDIVYERMSVQPYDTNGEYFDLLTEVKYFDANKNEILL